MDMRAAADCAPELGDGEYERSCTVDGDAGREEEVGYTEAVSYTHLTLPTKA